MRAARMLALLLSFISGLPLFSAAGATSAADLDAALARGAREGKQIVIEFSGRSWCPACKALTSEVLTTEAFAAFAADRIVVTLDYPRKSERTPEKIAADPELARLVALWKAYEVEGLPTVVLLNPEGKEIGRILGYDAGTGPAAFIAELTGR